MATQARTTMPDMLSVGDIFRQFIPTESGESLEEQIFPWNMEGIRQNMQGRLVTHEADPHTISNIVQMMAVEMQHWRDYLMYSKMTADPDFKRLLNSIARAEHVHHLKLMSLLPAPHKPTEPVLQGEVALLGLYGMCMNIEPNEAVKNALGHFFRDHMQHADFAAEQVRQAGCPVDAMTGGADLSGGRAIEQQFMKPDDTIWQGSFTGSYDKTNVDPATLINVDVSLAGEMTAWDTYHCAMESTEDRNINMNYAAFQSIEGQHLAILGSILDPTETPLERALVHEQVEMQNYQRLMKEEMNENVRKVFEDLYREDLEQARLFGEMAH